MNECNTSLFANPQYVRGKNVSAARCGVVPRRRLRRAEARRSASSSSGASASRRAGNPVPTDKSSPRATNPVDWLGFLGAWYRSSGRSAPLMDGLDLHPYPIPQSLPFETGYPGRTSFSVANLPRAYQAFYDAFKGTRQATVGPGRLPVSLNEVGIQTTPGACGRGGVHRFRERRRGGGDRQRGLPGCLVPQARRFLALRCGCDEGQHLQARRRDLAAGWQSGLFFAGYLPKLSAAAFTDELALTAGLCPTGRRRLLRARAPRRRRNAGIAKALVHKVVAAARVAGELRQPLTGRTPVR